MKTQLKLINEALREIAKWADDWLIILNPTKTNSITFTRKRETNWPKAKFSNTPEPLYNTVRYNTVLDITWIRVGSFMAFKIPFPI